MEIMEIDSFEERVEDLLLKHVVLSESGKLSADGINVLDLLEAIVWLCGGGVWSSGTPISQIPNYPDPQKALDRSPTNPKRPPALSETEKQIQLSIEESCGTNIKTNENTPSPLVYLHNFYVHCFFWDFFLT